MWNTSVAERPHPASPDTAHAAPASAPDPRASSLAPTIFCPSEQVERCAREALARLAQ